MFILVLFRLIKKRSFNLLCFWIFFQNAGVNSVSDFSLCACLSVSLSLSLTLSLSLGHTHTHSHLSLCLSLSHTHSPSLSHTHSHLSLFLTHTHTHTLSLSFTHAHTLSFSPHTSLSHTHTHASLPPHTPPHGEADLNADADGLTAVNEGGSDPVVDVGDLDVAGREDALRVVDAITGFCPLQHRKRGRTLCEYVMLKPRGGKKVCQ